jgi:hypothetical protein
VTINYVPPNQDTVISIEEDISSTKEQLRPQTSPLNLSKKHKFEAEEDGKRKLYLAIIFLLKSIIPRRTNTAIKEGQHDR